MNCRNTLTKLEIDHSLRVSDAVVPDLLRLYKLRLLSMEGGGHSFILCPYFLIIANPQELLCVVNLWHKFCLVCHLLSLCQMETSSVTVWSGWLMRVQRSFCQKVSICKL